MTVKQLSIFVENRPGRLSAVTRLLGDNGINIRAMSIADTKDFGILRLIVSDAEKAHDVLKNDGCSLTITKVLAIKIADKSGGLADAIDVLYKENISVEYMYAAFLNEKDESAYLILRVSDSDAAIEVFKENGFEMLCQKDLI